MRNNFCEEVFRTSCPHKTQPKRQVAAEALAIVAIPWGGPQFILACHLPMSSWPGPSLLLCGSQGSDNVLLVTAATSVVKSLLVSSEGLGVNLELQVTETSHSWSWRHFAGGINSLVVSMFGLQGRGQEVTKH